MLKRVLTITVTLIIALSVDAQDIRFTQYFVLPSWLNPALGGSYDGTYRISSIYRDQWRGALEKPLSSFAFNADTKFDLQKNRANADQVSVGLLLLTDRSNITDFNTNHLSVNLTYEKLLDKSTSQYLTGGFQIGISQIGLNYEDVVFGDQYNGVDQYSNPTSELFPPNSRAYMDMSLGILYRIRPRTTTTYYMGAGIYHPHSPAASFFDLLEGINVPYETEAEISPKTNLHIGAAIDLSKTAVFYPRLLWSIQNPVQEINFGGNWKKTFYTTRTTALHLGLYGNLGSHLESFHFNSIAGLVGIEVEELLIGFSYEQHMDDFQRYFGQGSFEISISYIGNLEDEGEYCPSF